MFVHQKHTRSYKVQATNWQRIQTFNNAWCLYASLPAAYSEETMPFPGNFKIQPEATRLAGKYNEK